MKTCIKCKVLDESVFKECPVSDLQHMLTGKINRSFKEGDIIYNEKTPANGIYCLYKGKVNIVRTDYTGKEKVLHTAQPGNVLAVHDVLTNSDYSSTAVAIEPTATCFIPSANFLELVKKDNRFSLTLMKYLLNELNDLDHLWEKGNYLLKNV